MAEISASKRMRLDEERDDELYLPDGNIVLSAKDSVSGNIVLFRVVKSLLAKSSAVLRGMLEMPLPCAPDMYDGVHRVDMPDDAHDLRAFLGMLHDPCLIPMGRFYDHIPMVSRALTIAQKYEADALCRRLISQLQLDWPEELQEYDELARGQVPAGSLGSLARAAPGALRLARRCDVQSIRRCALYCLLMHPCDMEENAMYSIHQELDKEDLFTLLVGRERLHDFIRGTTSYREPLDFLLWICLDDSGCDEIVFAIWEALRDEVLRDDDPIQCLRSLADSIRRDKRVCAGWDTNERLCMACRIVMANKVEAYRNHLWKELPRIMLLDAPNAA